MEKMKTGSPKLMKKINTSLVLGLIRKNEPLSRSEIAEKTGLALPTVMRIADNLLAEDYLIEGKKGQSTGGRKPVLLNINPDACYFLGVDIKRRITLVLTDLKGNKINKKEESFNLKRGPEVILNHVAEMVNKLLEENDIHRNKLAGIGIGTPGMNFKSGQLIRSSVFKGWHHIDINQIIDGIFKVPVVVDNVAKAGALGELWFGKGQDYKNFIYIFADYGVGSGVVINGDLYRGSDGDAGEFGHTTVDLSGDKKCYCGNTGCLEMYTSILAIIEQVSERLPDQEGSILNELISRDSEELNFNHILKAARMADEFAINNLKQAGKVMGIGLANLINLYNPDAIIIGGEIGCNCPWYVEAAKEAAFDRIFSKRANDTEIVVADIKEDATSMGAVALVMNKIFGLVQP